MPAPPKGGGPLRTEETQKKKLKKLNTKEKIYTCPFQGRWPLEDRGGIGQKYVLCSSKI